MYNSFIVRMFVGAANVFSLAYQDSFLKSIVNVFKRCISYLTNGSLTINLFIKNMFPNYYLYLQNNTR